MFWFDEHNLGFSLCFVIVVYGYSNVGAPWSS